jgi:Domain of unknown function (DUF4405)
MSRTAHNFWLDVTIFVALLITNITGFILWLVIPNKLGIIFLGFSRIAWVYSHICFGMAGLAGIVVHIVRHWDWLKALRGRPLSGMPEKLRANRIVDRIMWITFITTNVFGAIAWTLHFGDDIYVVSVSDRLHIVFGVAWTILMIVHLALHWKWIASTSQLYIHVNIRGTNDFQGKKILKKGAKNEH